MELMSTAQLASRLMLPACVIESLLAGQPVYQLVGGPHYEAAAAIAVIESHRIKPARSFE